MIRLFVALKIPGDIKKKIITLRDYVYEGAEKPKWEADDKLHLTLKFIGEVPGEIVDDIAGSLSFINDYEKFKCSFTGFGFFFRRKDPVILWAGFKADIKLFELADRLNKHFIRFGIPAEKREFNAHLTLLRIKNNPGRNFVEIFENFKTEELPFDADEIALLKSDLLPSGSRYTEIKSFKLK